MKSCETVTTVVSCTVGTVGQSYKYCRQRSEKGQVQPRPCEAARETELPLAGEVQLLQQQYEQSKALSLEHVILILDMPLQFFVLSSPLQYSAPK